MEHCGAQGGPSPCIGHSSTAVGHCLLVFGGRDFHQNMFREGAFIFDTTSGTWTRCRDPPHRVALRTGHCAVPCPSGIMFVGGMVETGGTSNDFLLWDLFGTPEGREYVIVEEGVPVTVASRVA